MTKFPTFLATERLHCESCGHNWLPCGNEQMPCPKCQGLRPDRHTYDRGTPIPEEALGRVREESTATFQTNINANRPLER